MLANANVPMFNSDTPNLPGYIKSSRIKRASSGVTSATPYHQLITTAGAESTEQTLIKLLHSHSNETGWIVLVAPPRLPSKALAEYFKLPVDKMLVIHPKALRNIEKTLKSLLQSTHCRVVISFCTSLSNDSTAQLNQQATTQQRWFYQFQQPPMPAH
jgi:cell division inhibitor SulA